MDFGVSPAGSVIISPNGYRAFVPHPLPPELVWDQQLANALSRANYLFENAH